LLYKNNESYGKSDQKISLAEIFRQVIGRILQLTYLPQLVVNQLNEARVMIREDDSLDVLNKGIMSVLYKLRGFKDRNERNDRIFHDKRMYTVKTIESEHPEWQEQENENYVEEPLMDDSATVNTSYQKNFQHKPFQKAWENRGGSGGGDTTFRGGSSKPSFVKPWPLSRQYLNGNENTLNKDFESYMQGHCYRCGNSSHIARDCRTYPERQTKHSLCKRCCQGLHEQCKSKRGDIVENKEGGEPAVKKMLQRIEQLFNKKLTQEQPTQQPFYFFNQPPSMVMNPDVMKQNISPEKTSDSKNVNN
jgi:hypothetical protein